MCGINGFQGVFQKQLIERMNSSIIHRGPDNSDFSICDDVALGHVRLSIIDLSPNSNQPLTSSCQRFEIVFNGEIYNFVELRESLCVQGVTFQSSGDSEVLLELWAKYGEKSLEMLDGIFAFAILDKKTGLLTIVRDHFGVKPLYYAQIDSGFIFSSEIKAILQSAEVPRHINLNAVASVVGLLWQAGESTVLEAIKKVPPGSLLRVQDGKVKSQDRYYTCPSYKGDYSLEASKEALEKNLVDSVESQLVSDVEVGAFLSGGLDSSLICAIAKNKNPEFKKVYSIDIDTEENKKEGLAEDLPFAKKVAQDLKLDLHVVKASADLANLLPKCLYHLDEPQADPAILNAYQICSLAKSDGVKVLLSGAGGDDLFTGYRRHYAAHIDSKLAFIPVPLRVGLSLVSKFLPSNVPLFRRIRKFISSFSLTGDDKLTSYFCWMDEGDIESLFAKGVREQVSPSYGVDQLKRFIKDKPYNDVEKLLDLEKEFFLVDHNFNYTDKMSMAHGVEVRVPFVTRRMAETAASIPTKYKQHGKNGKWILKLVAEKWLPKSVIYRSKTGFGAPLRSWLHGPLMPLLDELLSKEAIEKRGVFNYSAVRNMIEADKAGKKDNAYSIYALLSLEIWFRQFVDSEIPQELSIEELLN